MVRFLKERQRLWYMRNGKQESSIKNNSTLPVIRADFIARLRIALETGKQEN
jgi:hypothetical protein